MIRPEVAHHFAGDNRTDLFAFECEARFPDGERRQIVLRLGHPFKKPDADTSWIRSELENLDSTDGPIAGLDPMQAIILGIGWMIARLGSFQANQGCQYFWRGTEDEFDFRALLSTTGQSYGTKNPDA